VTKMKIFPNVLCILLLLNTLTNLIFPNYLKGFPERKDEPEYLSDLERQVVAELNLARTQPKKYSDFLNAYSNRFIGKELHEPGQTILLTKEGESAVYEAIRFLKNQKALSILTASKGMSRAAEDMVRMQETTSQIGHKGRDGSTFSERISRYGIWNGSCSENIDYGNNSARRIVMALIIDDGVKSRGHRKSIFEPRFKRVGVAFGRHQAYNYMCVIELAVSYIEK
jgi:uncharacterized protein YkwD